MTKPTDRMTKLTDLTEWQALLAHHQHIAPQHMRDWFGQDPARSSRFSLQAGDIFFDYSRNRINEQTITLLCDLAHAVGLPNQIEALFNGHPINTTEKRAALHTALRDKEHTPINVNGVNIAQVIKDSRAIMRAWVNKIHAGAWKGVTGKPIAHIVNIGIGGSYLGPMMCVRALKDFAATHLQFHFISSVDKAHVREALEQIDPETSLFIISSKSFGTLETLTNARTIIEIMQQQFGHEIVTKQFVAITAAPEKARAFGIAAEHILPLWEWVGGRYSVWSTIGLPLALAIGNDRFDEFLDGAYAMDQHFRTADFAHNIPVLMALLGIWYLNFFNASAHAVIPYSNRLRYLVPYLQQAEMESNGKSTDLNGSDLAYTTGAVIFGEEGINGQHAYHQLLHQGRHFILADFILVGKNFLGAVDAHQEILIASGLSQATALMRGKTFEQALNDLQAANLPAQEAEYLAKHQIIPGNRPSNILFLDQITPKNLGALLALYEHKVFVQGVIWNINSFDQWGIELGKQLLPAILQRVQNTTHETSVDTAADGLINHFKIIRGQ